MIVVEGLEKRFEGRTILAGVNVRIARGKVTAICGPSGGGKSTLLRCLVGLEPFDAGVVRVEDIALSPKSGVTAPSACAVRLRVGLVFQHFGLFGHQTVLENLIEAPLHVRHEPRQAAVERAEKLLERFGLTARIGAYPRELSGGEKQRVAIARALAMQPAALLLDEPTSALDPKRKSEMAALLRELSKDGTTVVVVTHEHALVRASADVAIVMRNGRVHAEGPPADVLSEEDED